MTRDVVITSYRISFVHWVAFDDSVTYFESGLTRGQAERKVLRAMRKPPNPTRRSRRVTV